MRGFLSLRKFSTSAVWEAGRKAREAARALAALPNEDRNAALERVAAALESGKVLVISEFVCVPNLIVPGNAGCYRSCE